MTSEQTARQIVRITRYGVTGVLTNGTIFLVFLLLIWLGVLPLLASALCYGLGVTLSYVINRRWTFASQGDHKSDLPRFLAAYGLGLGVTLLSMSLLLRTLSAPVAQLVTIGVAAIAVYGFLHLFRFGADENKGTE